MLTRRALLGGLLATNNGVEQMDVYRAGEDGYHTYRIPSVIATARGTLLAFVEGRKDDSRDHGDIDLLVKRSNDGGRTWSAQSIVHEEGGTAKVTIGNPCPVVDRKTGTLWLPFCRDNNDVLITSSTDDGLTWAKPRVITTAVKKPDWNWYATGPGIGIQIQAGKYKGRMVIPCDHGAPYEGKLARSSHIIYSDDNGKTWELGGGAAVHTNECQVMELNGGLLLLNMRNHIGKDGGQPDFAGRRAISMSADGGETWGEREFDAALIEPVCQGSLLRIDARTALFSNPASTTARVNMTVRLSRDEGRMWNTSRELVLHAGPSAYSCLTALPGRMAGCLYERGAAKAYELVTFARFPVPWS